MNNLLSYYKGIQKNLKTLILVTCGYSDEYKAQLCVCFEHAHIYGLLLIGRPSLVSVDRI